MATLVTKTVGPVGCDYRSLYELEALNYSLVARDEYWEITLEDECFHQGVSLDGWTTDSTRYLHFKGKNGTTVAKPYLQEQGYGMATICCVNGSNYPAPFYIHSIGANGYVIFENLRTFCNDGSAATIYSDQTTAHTIEVRKCILISNGGATASGVRLADADAVLKMHNSIIKSSGHGVYCDAAATLHIYNCTIYALTNGIECENNANNVIKNTYVKASVCIQNIGAGTMTNVATSDATGSVGLQNVAFDHTNFKSIAREFGSHELMTGSGLIAAGASIVGQAAPFDYTTDFQGKAITAATPDIGALQWYDEDPIIINRYLKATVGDYTDMADLDGKNIDQVTLKQRITVHCYPFTDSVNAATFNGWNTDSTYYLHIKGLEQDSGGARYEASGGLVYGTGGYVLNKSAAGVAMIQVTDIGENGYIIFEGFAVLNTSNGAGTQAIAVDDNYSDGTVLLKRMRVTCTGNANAICIQAEAAFAGELGIINCSVVNTAAAIATGGCLSVQGGTVKAYHSTFLSLTANGDAVDMGNIAGGELVNCYASAAGAGKAYDALTDVTVTTCASDDATGTLGLRTIPWDATNFYNISANNYSANIRKGGSLYKVGTNLSAYTAPYNISEDLNKAGRPNPPSVGCCDIPSIYATWTSELGIAVADVNYTYNPTLHKTGKKVYFGAGRGATKGKIYSWDGIGSGFTKVYEHTANEQIPVLAYHTDGKMYGITDALAHVIQEGAPWTDLDAPAAHYLGGAASNPTAPNSLISRKADSMLYCGHGNSTCVHKDADGAGAWTTDLGVYYAGAVSNAAALWIHPTTGTLYATMAYGVLISDTGDSWSFVECFPDAASTDTVAMFNDKVYAYIIRDDDTGINGFYVYRALLSDMKFKKISYLPYVAHISYMSVAVGNNQIYVYGPYISAGDRAMFYSSDCGVNWSICPTVDSAANGPLYASGYGNMTAQIAAIWQGRWVFAQSYTGAVLSGVLYSEKFPALEDGGNVLFTFGGVV